jgi:hypothetical protein
MYVFAVYSATLMGYVSTEILNFPQAVRSVLLAIFPGSAQ